MTLAIAIPPFGLEGDLEIPRGATGLVMFAHGSGSSRLSPRNRQVANALHESGLATLLFDLLRPEESKDRRLVFDIGLLANRLLSATDWLRKRKDCQALAVGYFGASTGAAAALVAAAQPDSMVAAVVSRGGRPDLAMAALPKVRAPTLLIVGEEDREVLALNWQALEALRCEKSLLTVPGATHLFEEPGALELVTEHARRWFLDHLSRDVQGPTA
jgi:putative phosphoribosyl transferase